MMCNNRYLVLINMMHVYNLPNLCQFLTNMQKMTAYNLVNINAYIKVGEIMSICSQGIEWKRNTDVNQGQ